MVLFFFILALTLSGRANADDSMSKMTDSLTLDQKVGQLLIIGFHGQSLSEGDIAHIRKIRPGGIVFFGRNFKSASDIPPVIAKIRAVLDDREIPLFFAIDQEGGVVHRIEGEYYKPPSAPAIGAANSERLSRATGRAVGNALRKIGINMNLAPVLDVPADIRLTPILGRCFSDSPERVTRLGVAYIEGIRESGVLSAAKHFPGIGRARDDSHFALPHVIWKSAEDRNGDLLPFVEAGRSGVDAIMTGHFIAEPGDGEYPASLSSYWMKDVLRGSFGFEGLVIVDNIEMKPIMDSMDAGKSAVKSFLAGADVILVSHEKKNQTAAYRGLLDAAEKGVITPERIDESLVRILKAKKRMQAALTTPVADEPSMPGVSREVAENSILLVRRKAARQIAISQDGEILYAGFNPDIYAALKSRYRRAGMLNSTIANLRKKGPSELPEASLEKYDLVVIDGDYPDAEQMAGLCREMKKDFIVITGNFRNLESRVKILKPDFLYASPENRKAYFSVISDILRGSRQAKGAMPYNLSLPPDYEFAATGM